MRIGAHVDIADPVREAADRAADLVQLFLADPTGWQAPAGQNADELRSVPLDIYVHAPYVINVASGNNRIRIPSRKLLETHANAAAAIGAAGLVVHGGHVTGGTDPATGLENWRKTFEYAQRSGGFATPILVENTAGGENSCARRFEALARLWDVIGPFGAGFCLDTCHAYCGGEDLVGIVDRVKAITGRIDLVHANNARDGFNSGRDRHANLTSGTIPPELIVDVVRSAGAPVVVETPGGSSGQGADIAYLRERVT